MLLVEKPVPKDLVGLHRSFGVVPPLIRLRGAELLEVMKEAAEKAKSIAEINSASLLAVQPKSTSTRTVFDQESVIVADLWSFSNGNNFHSLPTQVIS